jgi:hypothetical protein
MLVYIALLLTAFLRMRRVMHEPATQFNGTTILFTFAGALLIDRVVIAIGRLIGPGPLLAGLNLGRLWLVAMLAPLLIVTYVEFSGRLKVKGAGTQTVAAVVWALAWLLFAAQVWGSLGSLSAGDLAIVEGQGLLYYAPVSAPTAPGTIAANLIGFVFGIFILVRSGWPLPLLGAGLVLAEAVFFPQPFIIEKGLEVAWIWALVLTDWRAQKIGLQINRGELDTRLDQLG